MKIKRFYQIGHLIIGIEMPVGLPVPENMTLFSISEDEAREKGIHRKYCIDITEKFPEIEKELHDKHPNIKVMERPDLKVLYTPEMECRGVRFAGDSEPYAIHLDKAGEPVQAWVHPKVLDYLPKVSIFLSLLGLEKEMVRLSSMAFHSAYIMKGGKAILFSAPSGTGKSTQASLWEQYRGAKAINGDRSLLICDDGIWHAYGLPICGSSGICHNETYPIGAIVMLYQSKENRIRRLSGAEAVEKVISQMMVNTWDAEYIKNLQDLVQQLVKDVSVFELGCNISEDAVVCLESVL